MPKTLYIDGESTGGGNDNYGGTSFALLHSNTDGSISSTTFTTALGGLTAINTATPLAGHYISRWNASIYAVYEIVSVNSDTTMTLVAISGGTSLANDATGRQFYIGGRWKTENLGALAVRTVPGDTKRHKASPDPTSLGMTATWTNQSPTVTLNAAVTKDITLCESAWTSGQGANVTCTTSATRKEGSLAASIAVAAGATTGLIAYFPTGTLDFSGYQQVSFWIQPNATLAASTLRLELCTDTAGVTSVHSVPIPAMGTASAWHLVTYDLNVNMNAAVASVALYADIDPGAYTVIIDNILACKDDASADSLTLNSLIGKNTAGETWHGLRSINGVTLTLEGAGNATLASAATKAQQYYGTNGTVTTYKRQCIRIYGASDMNLTESGTLGNQMISSGGWNRTDMSTLTGETWYEWFVQATTTYGVLDGSRSYITLSKIAFARCQYGPYFQGGVGNILDVPAVVNCPNGSQFLDQGGSSSLTIGNIRHCGTGLTITTEAFGSLDFAPLVTITYGIYSCGTGIITTGLIRISGGSIKNNIGYGIDATVTLSAKNVSLADNTTSDILARDNSLAYLNNCTLGSTNEVYAGWTVATTGGFVYSEDHDGAAGVVRIFHGSKGVIDSETSVRHTASGLAWKSQPLSTTLATSPLPVAFRITGEAGIFCLANQAVTVKAWLRRTNTGLTFSLVCPGRQIAGVDADVSSSMTAAADTWEEITITFTPTEDGYVDIYAYAYGGTTYAGYVDDITVTLAGGTIDVKTLDYVSRGQPWLAAFNSAGGAGGIKVHTGMSGGVLA